MKRQTLGLGRQCSKSQEAEVRFGLVAEASFLIPLGRVGFLVVIITIINIIITIIIITLVKEVLIEIGCVMTSLVVGWLVVTRGHCGQTVHPRPIVTMEH